MIRLKSNRIEQEEVPKKKEKAKTINARAKEQNRVNGASKIVHVQIYQEPRRNKKEPELGKEYHFTYQEAMLGSQVSIIL